MNATATVSTGFVKFEVRVASHEMEDSTVHLVTWRGGELVTLMSPKGRYLQLGSVVLGNR